MYSRSINKGFSLATRRAVVGCGNVRPLIHVDVVGVVHTLVAVGSLLEAVMYVTTGAMMGTAEPHAIVTALTTG